MYYAIKCLDGIKATEDGTSEPNLYVFNRKSDLKNFIGEDIKTPGWPWPSRKQITKREAEKLVKRYSLNQYARVTYYPPYPFTGAIMQWHTIS